MAALEYHWSPPDPADPLGLVALDRHLSPARLISAYRRGIFPGPILLCPARFRGCVRPAAPSSSSPCCMSRATFADLSAIWRPLRFTIDTAFEAVIRACAAAPRPGQSGTWITPAMIEAYIEVHRLGHAHSVEAVGMATRWSEGFMELPPAECLPVRACSHRVSEVSKLCVLRLVDHLRAHDATWIDIQQLTPQFRAARRAGNFARRVSGPAQR